MSVSKGVDSSSGALCESKGPQRMLQRAFPTPLAPPGSSGRASGRERWAFETSLSQTRLFCSRRSADHAASNAPRRSLRTKRRGRRPISLRSVSGSPRALSRRAGRRLSCFRGQRGRLGSGVQRRSLARDSFSLEQTSLFKIPFRLVVLTRPARGTRAGDWDGLLPEPVRAVPGSR